MTRYAPAARRFLAVGVVFAGGSGFGAVLFAGGLSATLVGSINAQPTNIAVAVALAGLALRVLSGVGLDWSASRAGSIVKSRLRDRVLGTMSHSAVVSKSSGATINLLTRGIDSLDPYFGQYIPQLIATAVMTPIVVGALWLIDPLSGLAVSLTIPLIPFFMVLIGWATKATQERQWIALSSLSSGFLDVVSGLSTLQLFGRANRQVSQIRDLTEKYRIRTMSVLRMSFLSGFALEVGASLSVAVVAVSIGLRLVDGSLDLGTGLWALVLAPDVFIALRRVGALFHASAEGLTVVGELDALIESADQQTDVARSANATTLDVRAVSRAGRLGSISFRAHRGELVLLSGPSGCGKSTLFEILRGKTLHDGEALWGETRVTQDDVAWSPQGLALIPGTVRDNIVMFRQGDESALRRATDVAQLDFSLETEVGNRGVAVSGGQAARISLARAVYRVLTTEASILLLDEPTASLDRATEVKIVSSLKQLAIEGFLVMMTSHRPTAARLADQIIEVGR